MILDNSQLSVSISPMEFQLLLSSLIHRDLLHLNKRNTKGFIWHKRRITWSPFRRRYTVWLVTSTNAICLFPRSSGLDTCINYDYMSNWWCNVHYVMFCNLTLIISSSGSRKISRENIRRVFWSTLQWNNVFNINQIWSLHTVQQGNLPK